MMKKRKGKGKRGTKETNEEDEEDDKWHKQEDVEDKEKEDEKTKRTRMMKTKTTNKKKTSEKRKRNKNLIYKYIYKTMSQMDAIHYLPSVVRLQNANKVITCRFLVQPTLCVHCHKLSFCLVYVPVHVFPLPMNPVLQVQLYEPILLLHCAFT